MRRIIQIATALSEDDHRINEALYVLDSDGQVWEHRTETSTHTSGWEKMSAPWDDMRKKKEKT